LGRLISVEEALKVLDVAEEAGLVIQLTNSQNPGGLCCCCGDCCALLRALNKMPRPAEVVASKYFAVADTELCTGCEFCVERCQMGAISLTEESLAQINLDRCIGCGLCVTQCPAEAIHLEIKPESRWVEPPETAMDALTMTAKKRGKAA
jgi:electron transport complex protein RnfB